MKKKILAIMEAIQSQMISGNKTFKIFHLKDHDRLIIAIKNVEHDGINDLALVLSLFREDDLIREMVLPLLSPPDAVKMSLQYLIKMSEVYVSKDVEFEEAA